MKVRIAHRIAKETGEQYNKWYTHRRVYQVLPVLQNMYILKQELVCLSQTETLIGARAYMYTVYAQVTMDV
jgi:hypothetical protein